MRFAGNGHLAQVRRGTTECQANATRLIARTLSWWLLVGSRQKIVPVLHEIDQCKYLHLQCRIRIIRPLRPIEANDASNHSLAAYARPYGCPALRPSASYFGRP